MVCKCEWAWDGEIHEVITHQGYDFIVSCRLCGSVLEVVTAYVPCSSCKEMVAVDDVDHDCC